MRSVRRTRTHGKSPTITVTVGVGDRREGVQCSPAHDGESVGWTTARAVLFGGLMRSTLLLLIAPFAMAACVDSSLPDGLPDPDPDPDPTPDPTPDPEPEPEPAPLACDGTY